MTPMPRRKDLESILIIGSGPIVIGQACEFDYSGTQACKALREEGLRVVLINSNPATIMTDPELADATYVEPLTVEVLDKVLAREKVERGAADARRADRPQPGDGRAQGRAVREARRRAARRDGRVHRDGRGPRAVQAGDGADRPGVPAVAARVTRSRRRARASTRSGSRRSCARRSRSAARAAASPTTGRELRSHGPVRPRPVPGRTRSSIEESVLGWKEYELEVVRDAKDNVVIVCSIENLDPMGVHTGDSITVAPAMTLTDKEYQRMRDASIAIMREIGVTTGGSNVQFAVDPTTGAHARHRDEPARVAELGAGVEGDRVPDREDRGEARDRLHARRAAQRHHPRSRRRRSSRPSTTWSSSGRGSRSRSSRRRRRCSARR